MNNSLITKDGYKGTSNQLSSNINLDELHSLSYWVSLYWKNIVSGAAPLTEKAKKADLTKFLSFFLKIIGHDHIHSWTPSVSKHFQNLLSKKNDDTIRSYSPSTINRIFATLKHFAKWVHKQHPFISGFPLDGVKDLTEDDPNWNGLTQTQVIRLRSACDKRIGSATKQNQNPLLEIAVFLTLLNTGLRESELVSLNISDYHSRGFHNVKRKGNKITRKVPVPQEAKSAIDKYLKTRAIKESTSPLLISKYNNRFSTRDVRRVCERLSKFASALLPEEEKFHLSPHMLRHTFLKKIADTHGVHIAQKMSGNVSMSEIFRYTKPSQDEIDHIAGSIQF